MAVRTVETSPQLYARICGWIYLMFFAAGFAELSVFRKLVVSGDAAATAQNIMAAESLWRLGFASYLAMVGLYVAVTLFLYVLLRPVSTTLAALAAFFSLVACAVLGIAGLGYIAPLLVLGGGHYLAAFDPHQLQALALLALKLHGAGYAVSMEFFGIFCLLLGYLIFRSSYFPKALGVLLFLGGLGYIASSIAGFLAPAFGASLSLGLIVPGGVAELSLCLWLIVKGVNVTKWEASR